MNRICDKPTRRQTSVAQLAYHTVVCRSDDRTLKKHSMNKKLTKKKQKLCVFGFIWMVFGVENYLGIQPAIEVDSAWPSSVGRRNQYQPTGMMQKDLIGSLIATGLKRDAISRKRSEIELTSQSPILNHICAFNSSRKFSP